MVTENVILKYAKNNPKGCDSKWLITNTKDPLHLPKRKKAFSIKNLHLWKRGTGNISSESASQAVELPAKSNWLLHFYTFPPKHSKIVKRGSNLEKNQEENSGPTFLHVLKISVFLPSFTLCSTVFPPKPNTKVQELHRSLRAQSTSMLVTLYF